MAEEALTELLAGQQVALCPLRAQNPPYQPVCKRDVTYIVCGILFNEEGHVLMMQEAKENCYGKWYLPAGRMEPDETIIDAVKREVTEETGLEMEPTTLLSVEVVGKTWYRFTMAGTVTGGSLKTPAQKDKESLQARWIPVSDINVNNLDVPLRMKDILPLIKQAVKHREAGTEAYQLNPSIRPHLTLNIRLILLHPPHHVLFDCCPEGPHLPHKEIVPDDWSLGSAMVQLISRAICYSSQQVHIVGVASVEHCGKPKAANDGLCITLLMSTENVDALPDVVDEANYQWFQVGDSTATALNQMTLPNRIVPLLLLR